MASPPRIPGAGSPPYPNPASLPQSRKRPAQGLSIASNVPYAKRRKSTLHSAISTPGSLHPLRQTSFPPEESALDTAGIRSPSNDSDITALTGSRSVITSATGVKGKRGRKKKVEGSVVNLKSTTRQGADGTSTKGAGDDVEEDDDDDDAGEGLVNDGEEIDKVTEKENLAVLVEAFDGDQLERYEAYRRAKLRKETVRKIANQTLSQSVPPAVITTINGYTKVFIGSLIERAREIQQQHAGYLPTPPLDINSSSGGSSSLPSELEPEIGEPSSFDSGLFSPSTIQPSPSGPRTHSNAQSFTNRLPDEPLGPLLPDHLREAFRRYKRDGGGGGSGLEGLSLGLGVKGAGSARLGGRRLFI